jgi:hypothetical protein
MANAPRHAAATSAGGLPETQSTVICHVPEIIVARQQHEVVADAELREKSVDGSNLYASTAADVTKFRRIDVILSVRHQQGQSSESFNDLLASFGT